MVSDEIGTLLTGRICPVSVPGPRRGAWPPFLWLALFVGGVACSDSPAVALAEGVGTHPPTDGRQGGEPPEPSASAVDSGNGDSGGLVDSPTEVADASADSVDASPPVEDVLSDVAEATSAQPDTPTDLLQPEAGDGTTAGDACSEAAQCPPPTGTCQVATCFKDGSCGLAVAASGTACDDGDPCTVGDACDGGACVATKKACPCAGPGDCAAYDDGDKCNGAYACDLAAGQCVKTDPPDCVGSSVCGQQVCVPSTGQCVPDPAVQGQTCQESLACVDFTCQAGQCLPTFITGKPCGGTSQCAQAVCAGGTCVTKDLDGASCGNNTECVSSQCLGGSCIASPQPGKPCSGGTCTAAGTCQASKPAGYGVAGCPAGALVKACTKACPACLGVGHEAVNDAGCNSTSGSCFFFAPGLTSGLVMYTMPLQTAWARWNFKVPLSGSGQVGLVFNSKPVLPSGCKAVGTVLFHLKQGNWDMDVKTVQASQLLGSTSYVPLFSGNLTGATSITVGNGGGPSSSCSVIVVDGIWVSN